MNDEQSGAYDAQARRRAKARAAIWSIDAELADLLGEREWILRTRTETRAAAVSGEACTLPWPEECRTQFGFAVRV